MFRFGVIKISDNILVRMLKNNVGLQNSYDCLNCKRYIRIEKIINHIKSIKHIQNSVLDKLKE